MTSQAAERKCREPSHVKVHYRDITYSFFISCKLGDMPRLDRTMASIKRSPKVAIEETIEAELNQNSDNKPPRFFRECRLCAKSGFRTTTNHVGDMEKVESMERMERTMESGLTYIQITHR